MLSPEAWVGVAILAYNAIATTRNGRVGRTTSAKVTDVHELVNGTATAQDQHIEQLAGALQAAGVDVPPRPKPNADGRPNGAPPSAQGA